MCFDGLTNLHTAHQFFVGSTYDVSFMKRQFVQEMNGTGQSVNAFYNVVVFVFLQSATLFFQVEAFACQANDMAGTVIGFHIETDTCLRIAFADNDFI